ncbi:MAG: hypothetical protein LBV50_06390 [Novosphingobium sp.]|jgi:hypothetical protein|nr:hypothetical protein [Novosphingobium sp.]
MRRIAPVLSAALIAALIAPGAAWAGYINNRAAWLALTPEARVGYVQGLNDSINYIFTDDSLPTALTKKGRLRCLVEQKTTSAILADRITMAYRDDRFAEAAPTALYVFRMQDVCRAYINAERANFGLPPA